MVGGRGADMLQVERAHHSPPPAGRVVGTLRAHPHTLTHARAHTHTRALPAAQDDTHRSSSSSSWYCIRHP